MSFNDPFMDDPFGFGTSGNLTSDAMNQSAWGNLPPVVGTPIDPGTMGLSSQGGGGGVDAGEDFNSHSPSPMSMIQGMLGGSGSSGSGGGSSGGSGGGLGGIIGLIASLL